MTAFSTTIVRAWNRIQANRHLPVTPAMRDALDSLEISAACASLSGRYVDGVCDAIAAESLTDRAIEGYWESRGVTPERCPEYGPADEETIVARPGRAAMEIRCRFARLAREGGSK